MIHSASETARALEGSSSEMSESFNYWNIPDGSYNRGFHILHIENTTQPYFPCQRCLQRCCRLWVIRLAKDRRTETMLWTRRNENGHPIYIISTGDYNISTKKANYLVGLTSVHSLSVFILSIEEEIWLQARTHHHLLLRGLILATEQGKQIQRIQRWWLTRIEPDKINGLHVLCRVLARHFQNTARIVGCFVVGPKDNHAAQKLLRCRNINHFASIFDCRVSQN